MKNPAATHKKFLFFALTILVVSLILHLIFNLRDYVEIQAYPYNEIFYEDSITVTSQRQETQLLVPVGITVGVRFYTDGIMVLRTDKIVGNDGTSSNPSEGKLFPGDIVLKAGDTTMFSHSQLSQAISNATNSITLEVLRDSKTHSVDITPAISGDDGRAKIGCWVRDSTQGLGTITYYDPNTRHFGALGHGIMDVDTRKLMTVRHGQIMESNIIDIVKGKKGEPGELIGEIRPDAVIGAISKNTTLGLYGQLSPSYSGLPTATYAIARHDQIHQGPAKIFSNIEGGDIKTYDVYIESVNEDADAEKGMVVRITDQGLITRTNGIVQGMSGSPIVQDGKIVGAITHVFVQNPLRGYGVFIEKMLLEGKAA